MEGGPFSQPDESPPHRKRPRHYSEKIWPMRGNPSDSNVIYAAQEGGWESVESVTINGTIYEYNELEECDYELYLSSGIFKIKSESEAAELSLPCKPVDCDAYRRAKFLYEKVAILPNLSRGSGGADSEAHVITCRARPGREADTDSGGDDIPDPPIIPVYTEAQMGVVNFVFNNCLLVNYKSAMAVGLYNCVGKYFLDGISTFADLCTRANITQGSNFMCRHNTSTGSPQPGAFWVKWSIPKKGNLTEGSRSIVQRERYADHIIYDRSTSINVVVGEVKESAESAIEAQNNEQMLGLWKPSQQAMLGIEAHGQILRPKILYLNGGKFTMCYLKSLELGLGSDLQKLAKLIMAFFICVRYTS